MSARTNEILESIKTLSLVEAAELVSRIEETFGVDASVPAGRVGVVQAGGAAARAATTNDDALTFSVILDSIASDKRVAALKAIRSLTDLGLKEAKDFCSSLPKVVKEGLSKADAEATKNELESAGGTVLITGT